MVKLPELLEPKAVDDSVNMMNEKCVTLAQIGKSDEAVGCYDRMMSSFGPSYGIANFMKGSILMGKGEYDKARQCFDETAKIFPDDPDVKICMAICDARKKQRNKAIENMNEALKLAPAEVRILVAASLLSYELNDEKKGTEFIKKALEINPYATYEYWEAAAKGFLTNPKLDSSEKDEIKDLISENRSLLKDIKEEADKGNKKKK